MPNLLVDSGPGTGKSYTIENLTLYLRASNKEAFLKKTPHTEAQLAVWQWAENVMSEYEKPSMIYMAYNKDTVTKSSRKVHKDCKVHTLHGAGYAVIQREYGYVPPKGIRSQTAVQRITGKLLVDLPDKWAWTSAIKYVEKLKDELLSPSIENLEFLRHKYDNLANWGVTDDIVDHCLKIMNDTKTVVREAGIDYIDQIWLPLFMIKRPIFDLGLVDEAQDLSPARLLLTRKLCSNLIYVGDPNQAINAFSGADPHSFEKIEAICEKKLPLKETFRLPANIVEKLNTFKKDANIVGVKKERGMERQITLDEMPAHLPDALSEALVVCRYNAGLMQVAVKCIKNGIPSRILGRSLLPQLEYIVKSQKAGSLEQLKVKLDQYETNATRNVEEDYIKEAIIDKIDCIRLVLPLCAKVDEVIPELKKILSPEKDKSLTFCTIHKSKGLEAKNIFILFPPVQSRHAKTADQVKQEDNLHFVAVSRTEANLFWVMG